MSAGITETERDVASSREKVYELNVDDAHATGCHSKARWLFRVASNFTGFDGDSRCSRVQGLVLEGFTVQGLRGRNCKKNTRKSV